jgi:hypothetical protein
LKVLLVIAAVVTTMGALSAPALADGAGAASQTVTFNDVTLPPAPIFGACAPAGTLASASDVNGIFHITVLTSGVGAGTGWFTATLEGQATAVTPAGITYSGHFSEWFGSNNNLHNDQAAATFNVDVRASDGSMLDLHETLEANNTPSGQANLVMQASC